MKDFLLKRVETLAYAFNEKQVENIKNIVDAISERLTGELSVFGSGSGFYHLAMQQENNSWLVFHCVTGDITISDSFATSEGVYEAFWEDHDKVCGRFPKSARGNYGDGTERINFEEVDLIVKDILKENYATIF